ncbi:thioredoxin domain-containing protein [Parahaliea maris]|uniref:Thioredoxin domain-containing protein n=1 Tax=Parahaliea maris TaxID=2716870 RepID=A0A5C9A4J4_9GAMM|nr:thioredoxin domain-containing protein [Parahaliea maris]
MTGILKNRVISILSVLADKQAMKMGRRQASGVLRVMWIFPVMLAAMACDPQETPGAQVPASGSPSAPGVVGAIAGSDIALTDVEQALSLSLHDIDLQRYRLLRGTLEARLLEGLDTNGAKERVAEIYLQPPVPPRVDRVAGSERVRPKGEFPIEIGAFCNLESSHCLRLQKQLSHVLPLYAGLVQSYDRELVLPFHRYASQAAEASFCALEQGRYWQFRDLMFAGSGPPDQGRILTASRGAGLSEEQFTACMEKHVNRSKVRSDAELAREIGVNSVPAVFVNGLYAGSQPEPWHLVWLIELELKRLDLASPRMASADKLSVLPLQVTGLLYSATPGLGLAAIAPAGARQAAGFYREGDSLGGEVTVRRIARDRVEILNRGVAEWVGFDGPPELPTNDSGVVEPAEPEQVAALQYPHRGVPVTLDRTEVLVRMSDVAALEADLEPVPLTAGGYHLLRVATIAPGGLYELLGLEEGDVIVLVNEKPMHEGDKPLWNALQSADEVRLRVMRKGGLAHHLTYRFEN